MCKMSLKKQIQTSVGVLIMWKYMLFVRCDISPMLFILYVKTDLETVWNGVEWIVSHIRDIQHMIWVWSYVVMRQIPDHVKKKKRNFVSFLRSSSGFTKTPRSISQSYSRQISQTKKSQALRRETRFKTCWTSIPVTRSSTSVVTRTTSLWVCLLHVMSATFNMWNYLFFPS